MTRIWERVVKDAGSKSRRKDFKLPTIIPVVFYEGSGNWTAPLNFKDKVKGEGDFERYVPNFEYHLFSVKDVNFEELERVVNALSVIIGMEAKGDLEDAVEWLKGIFDKLPHEEK